MRTADITVSGLGSATMRYPDEVCFAYNPNFIELDAAWGRGIVAELEVTVTCALSSYTPTLNIKIYDGRAKIYLSKLFQLLFEDVKHYRMLEVTVAGSLTPPSNWFSFTTKVMWGSIELGERMSTLGVFRYDAENQYFEREIVWFKNFPFKVSLLRLDDEDILTRHDSTAYVTLDGNGHDAFSSIVTLDAGTTINDGPATGSGGSIVYDTTNKCFLCYKSSQYYRSWESNSSFEGSEKYNTTITVNEQNIVRPLSGVEWEKDGLLFFYESQQEALLQRPNYSVGSVGMFEVTPSVLFPDAVNRAVIKITPDGRGRSVFDYTFDYTFFSVGEKSTLVRLLVSNKKCGFYLRWIDRMGLYQFFLFAKGVTTTKNKPSEDEIEDMDGYPMYFNGWMRNVMVTAEKTLRCCAENLSDSVYGYVETILTSPVIDLYLGTTKGGTEMWQPVRIISGQTVKQPLLPLRDLEIEINLPAIQAQSL